MPESTVGKLTAKLVLDSEAAKKALRDFAKFLGVSAKKLEEFLGAAERAGTVTVDLGAKVDKTDKRVQFAAGTIGRMRLQVQAWQKVVDRAVIGSEKYIQATQKLTAAKQRLEKVTQKEKIAHQQTTQSIATAGARIGVLMLTYRVLTRVIGNLISVSNKQEDANQKLSASLRAIGKFSQQARNEMIELSSEFQTLLNVEDIVLTETQAVLAAFTGLAGKGMKPLLRATVDLASGLNLSLLATAQLVAKTIDSNTNALTRYGIEIEINAPKLQKIGDIITEVNKKFGGLGEQLAKSEAAELRAVSFRLGDLQERMGDALKLGIVPMIRPLQDVFLAMQKIPEPALASATAVGALMIAVIGLNSALDILGFKAQVVGKVLGILAAAVAISVFAWSVYQKALNKAERTIHQLGEELELIDAELRKIGHIKKAANTYDELAAKQNLTTEETARLTRATRLLNDEVGLATMAATTYGEATDISTEKVRELVAEQEKLLTIKLAITIDDIRKKLGLMASETIRLKAAQREMAEGQIDGWAGVGRAMEQIDDKIRQMDADWDYRAENWSFLFARLKDAFNAIFADPDEIIDENTKSLAEQAAQFQKTVDVLSGMVELTKPDRDIAKVQEEINKLRTEEGKIRGTNIEIAEVDLETTKKILRTAQEIITANQKVVPGLVAVVKALQEAGEITIEPEFDFADLKQQITDYFISAQGAVGEEAEQLAVTFGRTLKLSIVAGVHAAGQDMPEIIMPVPKVPVPDLDKFIAALDLALLLRQKTNEQAKKELAVELELLGQARGKLTAQDELTKNMADQVKLRLKLISLGDTKRLEEEIALMEKQFKLGEVNNKQFRATLNTLLELASKIGEKERVAVQEKLNALTLEEEKQQRKIKKLIREQAEEAKKAALERIVDDETRILKTAKFEEELFVEETKREVAERERLLKRGLISAEQLAEFVKNRGKLQKQFDLDAQKELKELQIERINFIATLTGDASADEQNQKKAAVTTEFMERAKEIERLFGTEGQETQLKEAIAANEKTLTQELHRIEIEHEFALEKIRIETIRDKEERTVALFELEERRLKALVAAGLMDESEANDKNAKGRIKTEQTVASIQEKNLRKAAQAADRIGDALARAFGESGEQFIQILQAALQIALEISAVMAAQKTGQAATGIAAALGPIGAVVGLFSLFGGQRGGQIGVPEGGVTPKKFIDKTEKHEEVIKKKFTKEIEKVDKLVDEGEISKISAEARKEFLQKAFERDAAALELQKIQFANLAKGVPQKDFLVSQKKTEEHFKKKEEVLHTDFKREITSVDAMEQEGKITKEVAEVQKQQLKESLDKGIETLHGEKAMFSTLIDKSETKEVLPGSFIVKEEKAGEHKELLDMLGARKVEGGTPHKDSVLVPVKGKPPVLATPGERILPPRLAEIGEAINKGALEGFQRGGLVAAPPAINIGGVRVDLAPLVDELRMLRSKNDMMISALEELEIQQPIVFENLLQGQQLLRKEFPEFEKFNERKKVKRDR
jgi:hypothetical protein